MKRILTLIIGALAWGDLWSPLASAQGILVIEGATVVSPHLDTPRSGASVVIQNGRIEAVDDATAVAVPDRATVIDGRGKWVIPGIVEFHSHGIGPDELRRALALGVTTAHTIARLESPAERVELSHESATPSPRLVLLDGWVGEFMERMSGQVVSKPQSAEEARRDVADMRRAGASAIKIWQDDGSLWFDEGNRFPPVPRDALYALVESAHDAGMRVAIHAWRLPFFRDAIDAGVDAVIHPVADSIVPLPLWSRVREQGLTWTTTMSVLLVYGDPKEYAERILSDARLVANLDEAMREQLLADRVASEFANQAFMPTLAANLDTYMNTVQQNTRNALANEVTVVVGSDAPPGVGTHLEIELLAETGLTPLQILAAATLNGARALGLDDRLGTIESGKLADLVVLTADPLEDVRNLRAVAMVIKGGHTFAPNALVAPESSDR